MLNMMPNPNEIRSVSLFLFDKHVGVSGAVCSWPRLWGGLQ